MTTPKTICIQVKDKDGVFLSSIILDYPTDVYLREALRMSLPVMQVHADTLEVLVNYMGLQLGGVSIEKGVIHNANKLRQEHYYKTGN